MSGGLDPGCLYGAARPRRPHRISRQVLYRNAEENLSVNVGVTTIGAALAGGINDSSRADALARRQSVHGATLGDLARKARVFITMPPTSTNRNPFVFSKVTFDALCSDFASYPVSHAVAASAAVPIIFSPIILQTFPTIARPSCRHGSINTSKARSSLRWRPD